MNSPDHNQASESPLKDGISPPQGERRRIPSRWASTWMFVREDLGAICRSWLFRGFLLASVVVTLLMLKGMQAEQKTANQMLEAVYAMYLLVWMHGIVFLAGSALAREADCLNDAILSRGVTRAEYIHGKILARLLAVLAVVAGLLVPASIWAIRQDKLLRTESGFVTSAARNTKVEAWDPKKVFAEVNGTVKEMNLKLGDFVKAGDVLAILDDRVIFDELENERRAEENARNEVTTAKRRVEDARRAVAQAEDAVDRAERSLAAKDLMSKSEQADRQTEIRSRKRDLQNAESNVRAAQDAVPTAERAVENALARVREARKRLAATTITAPTPGYVTELNAHPTEYVAVGTHLFTIAPLDEYQVTVPIYNFEEFKRLKPGLTALVKMQQTEYKGSVDRVGAMTKPDRWGRESNYGVVRFKGDGSLGLLGMSADVRVVLPPVQEKTNRVTAILKVLTGSTDGTSVSRTTTVTAGWMAIGLGKVLGTCAVIVTLTILASVVFRNSLIAILGVVGFYHISNLLFDFVGLKTLSYLEMVADMGKVLGGIAKPGAELADIGWLLGFAVAFAAAASVLFISRDPPK